MQIKDNTIKIISPAKVNLFLAVAKKQGDFHPVLNVMHTILLHDVLYVNYKKSNELSISIEFLQNEDSDGQLPDVQLEDNLIYKAITGLYKKLNTQAYSFEIFVEKNIPMQAGLAGGSSNAAAALIAAAKIFDISTDDERLLQTAKEIGSDIVFFLNGGCALYTGKGDTLDHTIQPMNREIIIAMPFDKQGLRTKDVYDKFDTLDIASDLNQSFSTHEHHHDSDCECHDDFNLSLIDACKQLSCADNIPLFNNLAFASESLNPALVEVKEFLSEHCGKENVLLCGSGSATFAFVPQEADAEEIIHQAKHKGINAIYSQLVNVKAKIIPNIAEF